MSETSPDFIVVGAGSSGSVLADRLSAGGRYTVTLLEAGPKDWNPWIHLPIGYGKTMWDPGVNWKFYTEPEPELDNRRIYWPRGRVLGGSSSINGLIAIRGQPQDYDRWRDLGNPGWGFEDVLPYFRRLECNDAFAGSPLHGHDGALHVSSIKHKHELIEAAIATAKKLGIPQNDDFNGARQEGAGYYQLTTRNGLRSSAARAYLGRARRRANLRIVTGAQATGVTFVGTRATGVTYVKAGAAQCISANLGIVLAAGALQSPQLLMLSGIGPAQHLKEQGIPVLIDRPAVGADLQDHLQLRLIYECTKPITTNDDLNSLMGRVKIGLQWLLRRSGPLAIGINQGCIFARALPESETPDTQFHIATLSADLAGAKPHPFSGFTLSVCQLRPESRGTIRLKSADPLAPPSISAQYLATDTDWRAAIAAVKLARSLARTEPLKSYVAREVLPGEAAENEEAVEAFIRGYAATIFHPVGTCRMGSDDAAVVDPRLKVRGTNGLWVVDCSIMPRLVSGNTNLPAIMIAEKAADMIIADSDGVGTGRKQQEYTTA